MLLIHFLEFFLNPNNKYVHLSNYFKFFYHFCSLAAYIHLMTIVICLFLNLIFLTINLNSKHHFLVYLFIFPYNNQNKLKIKI